MHRLLLVLPLTLALTLTLPAADWSQFRGPTGQGHADSKALPTEWGPNKNLTWRKELPGKGWSSPVVAAGKVFLTTAVESDGAVSLRTLRLDAKTGVVEWDQEVFNYPASEAGPRQSKNSYASPTPIVEGDKVYVHFGHLGIACLNTKDGSRVWANQTLKYSPTHGNGGSPALWNDLLIYSIDGTDKQEVVALKKATGKVAWQTPRNASPGKKFSFSTPLVIDVNGQEQVISSGSNVVMALEPKTGKEIWRVGFDGYSVVPRPVYANGLVYVSTGYDNPVLYAIRPDGTGDVTKTHVAWTFKNGTDAPRNASPLAVGDALYIVSDSGMLNCLDGKTGAKRWDARLGGAYSASPIYAGGLVYLLSEAGAGTVFRPGKDYEEVKKNPLGEKTLASYGVDGDALLIRTEKALYRIEKK